MNRRRNAQRRRWGVVFWCLCALVLVAPPPTAAQTGTSGIEGRVLDESGAVLPGATVTISSPALQGTPVTVSDESGRYRFTTLPSGVYRVTFELAGFKTVVREDLQVGLGTVVTFDPKLGIGQLEETLTVSGQAPMVDVRTTSATTNLPKELIAAMPTNRGVGELVKIAPGMRGGTNYGATGTISHTYDGVQARDTFRYPDVGSLEEVQIRPVGNDAEVATAGVNFIAAIKSGGNEFHGVFFQQWEGRRTSSNNLDDFLRSQGITEGNPRLLYRDTSADLGGRIIRDKLWFYVAARQQAQKSLVIGYKGSPGPDGTYWTDDDEQGNSDSSMTVRPTAKLSALVTPRQRVNFVYLWEEQRSQSRGAGAFTPKEAVGNYFLPNDLKKVEWTYNPTNQSIVNIFVANTQWNSISLPFSDSPPSFDNITRRLGGAYVNSVGSDSTPAGSNSERWIYNGNVSYYKPRFLGGNHDFKVGFEATREWYDKFQKIRGPGTGGTGNDFRMFFENGAPYEVQLYNSPFVSENNLNSQSLFVRDNWLIGNRLTVSLGVRVERYHAFLPEQSKPAGPYSPAAQYKKIDVYTWLNSAPRAAISYSLTPDNRTVLKATYGRFNDVNSASDGRIFNQNDYFAWRHKWSDLNGNRTYDHPAELGALVATESAQGAGLKILNPDLRQPKQDDMTVHIERELIGNLAIRTGYVYKRQFDKSQEINPARPYEAYNIPITVTDPGPDGRLATADDGGPVTYFDYPASLRGAAFDQAMRFNTLGYTDRFHNFEVTATKRMSNRWQMLASVLATHRNVRRGGIPQTPNVFFPLNQTWEYSGKLTGSYLMPWAIQVSAYYEYLSGDKWGRTARFTTGLAQLGALTLPMESPEANKRPDQGILDIRFEKVSQLPKGELRWGVEMFNAFNANYTTAQSTLSGVTYQRITGITPARRARLTASYRF